MKYLTAFGIVNLLMRNQMVVGGIVLAVVFAGGIWFLTQSNPNTTTPVTTQVSPATQTENNPATASSTTLAEVKEFTLEGSKFKFVPNEIKVKVGDTVKITFKNVDGFHDFVIKDLTVATKQFQSPGEETVEFTAPKAGTYEFKCSVGKHAEQGMTGTLIVE